MKGFTSVTRATLGYTARTRTKGAHSAWASATLHHDGFISMETDNLQGFFLGVSHNSRSGTDLAEWGAGKISWKRNPFQVRMPKYSRIFLLVCKLALPLVSQRSEHRPPALSKNMCVNSYPLITLGCVIQSIGNSKPSFKLFCHPNIGHRARAGGH